MNTRALREARCLQAAPAAPSCVTVNRFAPVHAEQGEGTSQHANRGEGTVLQPALQEQNLYHCRRPRPSCLRLLHLGRGVRDVRIRSPLSIQHALHQATTHPKASAPEDLAFVAFATLRRASLACFFARLRTTRASSAAAATAASGSCSTAAFAAALAAATASRSCSTAAFAAASAAAAASRSCFTTAFRPSAFLRWALRRHVPPWCVIRRLSAVLLNWSTCRAVGEVR
jgi:hypothetical protein